MAGGGYGSSGGNSGGGGFTNPFGSGGGGGQRLYGGPAGGESTPTGPQPGSFGLDITSPGGLAGSVQADAKSGGDLLGNLGKALFDDKTGLLSSIPLPFAPTVTLGSAAKAIGDSPVGQAIGGAAGAVGGAVGGALTSNDSLAALGPGQQVQQFALQQQFSTAPDSAEKQAVLDAIQKDPSHSSHLMYQYLQDQAHAGPDLLPGLTVVPGSLADSLSGVLGIVSVPQRFVERGIAGMDRLNQIRQLVSEDAARGGLTGSGTSSLNPQEATAYEHLQDGSWSEAQALDFLSANGAGLSHDAGVELLGQILTDPTVWLSLGAAGVAKVGLKGLTLVGREAATGATLATGRTGAALRLAGKTYGALDGTAIGRAAKITRTIIDPLHAVGGRQVVGEAVVNMLSDELPQAVHAAYGELATSTVLSRLHDLSPDVYDGVVARMGDYSGNLGRTIIAENHRAAAIAQGIARQLRGTNPGELVDALIPGTPAGDLLQQVKEKAALVGKRDWADADIHDLARRMASGFGHQGEDAWYDWLKPLGKDQLGYLHAASYGAANKGLLDAIRMAQAAVVPGAKGVASKLDRVVLLNRSTLTDIGAKGILEQLSADGIKAAVRDSGAATVEDWLQLGGFKTLDDYKHALVLQAQAQYPALAYARINPNRLGSDLARFETWLENRIADGVMPSQVTAEELKGLHPALQDLADTYKGSFDLGFSPELDKKWGLTPDLEGRLRGGFEVWVDHVADTTPGFRPGGMLRQNIAGMPILGKPARGALDALDAGSRTLRNVVSAREVINNAQARFIEGGLKRGLTESESKAIWKALSERAQLGQVSARSLKGQQMWEATAHLIPAGLYDSRALAERDLRTMVLDAFQGDLRFVGLTQDLTGRAKALLGGVGDNMVGHITEDTFPQLRFTYNPLFQTQRRLEGIILNSQRGVFPAFSGNLSQLDRETAALMDHYAKTGIYRIADTDMREYSALSLFGTDATKALQAGVDPGKWQKLVNVAAAERANVLRTFRSNLGKSLRPAMEKADPGAWDNIAAHWSEQAGRSLSDDEVAIKYLAEQAFHSDISVPRIIEPGSTAGVFDNAIKTNVMYTPRTLGETLPLEMDFMARRLSIAVKGANGQAEILDTLPKLRAGLADGTLKFDRIASALGNINAHQDYIDAVERALDFHYDGFMRTLTKRFNLDKGAASRIENMLAGAAEARGISPVDYLSEIISPTIGKGNQALIGELGKAVSVLRAPVKTGGSEEMLLGQLADIFHTHLDASARETLLTHFESGISDTINAIRRPGATVGAAQDAAARDLNLVSEALSGGESSLNPVLGKGWSKDSSRQFAKAVLDRIETGVPHANADVERAVQYFSSWSQKALQQGLLKGRGDWADLLQKVAGIPTDNAFAFNKTQQMMASQVSHALRASENDAFKLHFFNRNRTFLERSLNHMFFGIYPSSYMYGKILPELARFVATEPFGLRTGGLAYALTDVQKSLATQYEFDPNLRGKVDKLGKNGAVWFLGYLLPAVPWDVGAAAPGWARNLAQQAQDNADRADRGLDQKPIDLGSVGKSLADYLNPLRPINQAAQPVEALQKMFGGDLGGAAQGAAVPDLSQPITGNGLEPLLQDDLAPLREILSRAAGS